MFKSNYTIAATVLYVLATGCSVGPSYREPVILGSKAETFAAGSVGGESSETLASGWGTQVTPQLTQLLRSVSLNNNSIRLATANFEEASARFKAARGGFFPALSINAAGSGTEAAGNSSDRYQGGGQLSWELDIWGRIRKGALGAKYAELSQQEILRGVKISILGDFVGGYLALLGLDESLKIAERALFLREETLKLQQARFDDGAISLLDLKQSQAARDSVAVRIPDLKARIYENERALLVLLGATDKAVLPRQLKLSEVVLKLPAVRASTDALRQRPDVRAAEARAFGAEAFAAEAFRGLLPRISVDGVLNYDSDDFGSWIRDATRFWSLGGSAAWTAFRGGALWQNYQAAEARERAAMFTYAETVIAAANEIQAARERLAAGRSESSLRADELRSLGDALQTAKLLYSEGRVAYLNVLDSERDTLNSELLLVSSYIEQARRYVVLQRALGSAPLVD